MIRPNAGTQFNAIQADWCPELFFGGARGGGKSFFLLLDFLQDVPKYGKAWQGIVFRRSYPELQDLIKKAKDIFFESKATWFEQAKEFRWQNGAVLKFRYIEKARDADMYQGHEYCVAIGTLILMADGSSKPIEQIKVGDFVKTLEGAKEVTNIVSPYLAPCVSVVNKLGTQYQPIWHPILTDSGWQSYASIQGISSKGFDLESQELLSLPSVKVVARLLEQQHQEDTCEPQTSTSCHEFYSNQKSSDVNNLSELMQFSRKLKDCKQVYKLQEQSLSCKPLSYFCDDLSCEQLEKRIAQDCQDDCFVYFYQNDEQPLLAKESDQALTPLQDDVVRPCHEHCSLDVQGNTHKHTNLYECRYVHPYTFEERVVSEGSFYEPCVITPVGQMLVADISVADANHYISANTSLINKNTWIGWDELQQWENDEAYFKLLACLRSSSPVPTKRVRAGGNPGGKGHSWIKKYFIDPYPKGNQLIIEQDSSRMYIPSRVSDNPELLKNDPEYISRLRRVGNEQLVKAWLEGDWSVIAGAYYPEFNLDLHVVKPVTLPSYWFKYRSFDWGSAEPFFVHWIAVSDGQEFIAGNNKYWFPKGALIFYREWNGCNPDKPSEGLRLRNEEIANGIKLRTHENNIDATLTDSLPFQSRGGPTIASVFYDNGVPLTRADTERITGWTHVRDRLIGIDDMPLIYIFESNKYTIQYFPALQVDDRNPEDAVQSGEPTHCMDGIRYGCAAFPIIKEAPPIDKPIEIKQPTFDEIMSYVKKRSNGKKVY